MTEYPGVFLEEVDGGVKSIPGVTTSITAFVGAFDKGVDYKPLKASGYADFQNQFGGGETVRDYFTNGGRDAVIVRVTRVGATAASFAIQVGKKWLVCTARGTGAWSNRLAGSVTGRYTLRIVDDSSGVIEEFTGRTLAQLVKVANDRSFLVTVRLGSANEGVRGQDGDGTPDFLKGLELLRDVSFQVLVVPGASVDVYDVALRLCKERRAFLIADAPAEVKTVEQVLSWRQAWKAASLENAAVYFPRLDGGRAASGAVAGVYARTDSTRGVSKAPAGTDAILLGVGSVDIKLTDAENGRLNEAGINAIREFTGKGIVCWGARTMAGSLGNDWKYVPVRRLALFIEESLMNGLQWVVFEPNCERLWASVRLSVEAFMYRLFREGELMGKKPQEAFFVQCDRSTTTEDGVVNVVVGFAPLRPAEFVILNLKLLAAAREDSRGVGGQY